MLKFFKYIAFVLFVGTSLVSFGQKKFKKQKYTLDYKKKKIKGIDWELLKSKSYVPPVLKSFNASFSSSIYSTNGVKVSAISFFFCS